MNKTEIERIEKISYSMESQLERMIDVLQGIHEELVTKNKKGKKK